MKVKLCYQELSDVEQVVTIGDMARSEQTWEIWRLETGWWPRRLVMAEMASLAWSLVLVTRHTWHQHPNYLQPRGSVRLSQKRKVWLRYPQFNWMHYINYERLREFWKKILVVNVTSRNINKKRMNQMVLTIIRLCTYYYYDSGLDVGVEKSNKSWW